MWLLPTPAASNPNDGEDPQAWLERAERLKAKGVNGNGAGTPLAVAVALLPTPQARDGDGRGASHPDRRKELCGKRAGQLDEVAVHLLPTPNATPRATDATKGGPNQRGSSGDLMLPSAVQPSRWGRYAAAVERWEAVTGYPAPDPTVPGKKGQPTLNARLSEWMMGLPPGWLDVPGVSASAQKAAAGAGVVPQQAVLALRVLLGLDTP